MTRFHPSRHCEIRLFTRKKVCARCHSQQLLSSDQRAPHHSWRKAPPSLGAQCRGLAPSRNCHDAADRVVKSASDGSREASVARALCQPQAVLLAPHEGPHFGPGAHRFVDFACVPSVPLKFIGRLSIHYCVEYEVI